MTKDTERRLNMDLDKELLYKAKVQAAIQGKTLKRFVISNIYA